MGQAVQADQENLKRAIGICSRNKTQMNMIKLLRFLRDNWVWIPCTAIVSDADQAAMLKMIEEAKESGGLESLVGKTIVLHDVTRLVPDILQNGDDYFFPVFTAEEEMDEYGKHFSKVEKHFLEAACLARNNQKAVKGIVINAFSEPFIIPLDLFDLIARMPSSIEKEETENG